MVLLQMAALASVQLGSGRGQVGVPGSVCCEHGVLVGEPGAGLGLTLGCKALGICLLQCAIMHSAHAMTKGEGWVNGNNALMKRRQLRQWQPGSSPELQPLSSVKHSLILLLPSRAEWFHLFPFATPTPLLPVPSMGLDLGSHSSPPCSSTPTVSSS